ncbi:MAG TPA: dephospho-CoA kinase [Anaerolineales bacterium]|nr:dephospho-CoA kinase [Anaerolineales bacterium]
MSGWPDKFVIGLTGNIATGKSVVRRMLEHAGAFGIDADALSHRAIASDAPGYRSVIEAFGQYLVKENGEIDREKLGQIVFSDPKALTILESIVHPLVRQAVDHLLNRSKHRVIVIEAIKLLESPLRQACDVIWVVRADESIQLQRLKRGGMEAAEGRQRMAAQSSQEEKAAVADTVIENSGSITDTWEQVKQAWEKIIPEAIGEESPFKLHASADGLATTLQILRARPRQAEEIARFMNAVDGEDQMEPQIVVNSFGEKAFLLLQGKDGLMGLLGWKVENLVARVDDVHFTKGLPLSTYIPFLVTEVEEASKELQCEVALVFVQPELAAHRDLWQRLGYEERLPSELSVAAWQEAALESHRPDTVMLFKQLRTDRILRPI